MALLLLATAAVVAWDASNIRTGAAIYSRIGPEVVPYLIAGGLAALAVATLVSAFGRGLGPRPEEDFGPVGWIVGGLLVQIILIADAGFSIATGAVFAATAYAFGRRRLYITYPLGVVLALAIWIAFAHGLRLRLPAGPLERLF